jgi:hypothetical protein
MATDALEVYGICQLTMENLKFREINFWNLLEISG